MHRTRVSDGARGFSLVELSIVVALIAMMALIGAPWLVKIHQKNQVKSAAREIQTTLLAARMKAVKHNQQVSVVISAITPSIELQTIEPPVPTPNPTALPQILKLPARAVEFVATPAAAGGVVVFGGDGRLANFTNPTPAVYQIQGPVGKVMPTPVAIRVSSGGRVEVVTPTVWP
jgi:prepilin-type N-terminal cleavage/methylation domain-containing protein